MGSKFFPTTLAAMMAAAAMTACGVSPSLDQIATQAPSAPLTPMPEAGKPSAENNPFINTLEYDTSSSFSMLTDPVDNFKGTVVESYLYDVDFRQNGSWDYSVASSRPVGVVVVRDPQNVLYYLIYPPEKLFPIGQEISIKRFWKLREDMPLMNNMLVYMITHDVSGNSDYSLRMDYAIESPAEDGRFDGIIVPGTVEYLSPEPGN
jgi:hypothetical protein